MIIIDEFDKFSLITIKGLKERNLPDELIRYIVEYNYPFRLQITVTYMRSLTPLDTYATKYESYLKKYEGFVTGSVDITVSCPDFKEGVLSPLLDGRLPSSIANSLLFHYIVKLFLTHHLNEEKRQLDVVTPFISGSLCDTICRVLMIGRKYQIESLCNLAYEMDQMVTEANLSSVVRRLRY